MNDITSQNLTELIKNIKEKKISSEEVTKSYVKRAEKSKTLNCYITEEIFFSLIFLISSVKFCEVISFIIQQPLVQQKNLYFYQVSFLIFDPVYFLI